MGNNLPDGGRFRLFPGLLPILLSLAALLLSLCDLKVQTTRGDLRSQISNLRSRKSNREQETKTDRTIKPAQSGWRRLDGLAVFAFIISIPAIGYDRTGALGGLYNYVTSERALALLALRSSPGCVWPIRLSCDAASTKTLSRRSARMDAATLSGSVSP